MTQQESKQWAGILARAWGDENFKKRLLADPARVLKENGIQISGGRRVVIVEDTDKVVHLALPQKPTSDELAQETLAQVAGGLLEKWIQISS